MRVGLIGVGHVGLVTAACMADIGHDVVGMDDDLAKVAAVSGGRMPFYEPGLAELVEKTMGEGKLRITSEAAEAIRGAEVVFICGGTPSRADGSPNVAHVQQTTRVRLHDPVALGHVRDRFADANFCDKAEDAVRDAHAVVVRTEWDEYRAIAPERLAELLEYPIVVDARNVWRQDDLLAAGLTGRQRR